MKLLYCIALIICVINAVFAKGGIFERTNCVADGSEICGQWDSLCCSGKSVQAEDAYDFCGDKIKDKKEKEDKADTKQAETKQVPINSAAPPAATASPATVSTTTTSSPTQ
ncbi:hypothetical protein PIROE2DRAFT_3612 [Piromyces sp. E2]|nr:hypothetical protein PIROE2DRAFT_3612 [Piromyces sp. E2]|eukprot:OUM68623.1 hypothetical protein PIROE2DRAFT_3612 [Piromyces sp. E2]